MQLEEEETSGTQSFGLAKEFSVGMAMWEFRSHYVIVMSWRSKGRKTE